MVRHALGNLPRDHAAGADHHARPNPLARQEEPGRFEKSVWVSAAN
jgi:hypothetical protein